MAMMAKADIYRNPEASKIANSIGMMVLLISFSMLFAALLLGYIVFRTKNPEWPPMGMERLPLLFPSISTGLILISSLTYSFFHSHYLRGELKSSKLFLVITLLLGLGFMVSQFELWAQMHEMGYVTETGIFASLIYAFTWIHAAHIIAGILSLAYLLVPVFRNQVRVNAAGNVGKFWHFLDIVWVIIFVALFIV